MSVYSLLYTRLSGTVSNIVESMFAWMTQLELVSLRAVTRTEYRCATVIDNTSIGDSSTSVYKNVVKNILTMISNTRCSSN